MSGEERSVLGSAIVPFRLAFLMWFVFAADFIYGNSFSDYGVVPRTIEGLVGVLTMPLLHGGLNHIISNTFPLIVLGTVLFYFYSKIAIRVFAWCYLYTGLLVWIFGRDSIHIGASGLIYGLAAFLISYGLIRRDLLSILISLVIMVLYGSLIYGILPIHPYVSWESHLFGAIIGIISAYLLRNKNYR